MESIIFNSGGPTFMEHIGVVRFTLSKETLDRLRQFQHEYPDVSIDECSLYINKAIMNAMEEYELQCHNQ